MGKQNYEAAMVLSGVGDALGYRRGIWENCTSGAQIHAELRSLGGVERIRVAPPDWIVSDDTVMHLATAQALLKHGNSTDKHQLYRIMTDEYKACMADMTNRSAGITCTNSLDMLRDRPNEVRVPFNPKGGGSGAAMRAMCIGLRHPRPTSLKDLVEISIESARITHHHPTGYLGSLASALFTAYAIQQKQPREWGAGMLSVLPMAKTYISENSDGFAQFNLETWNFFESRWKEYLQLRNITSGTSNPDIPVFDIDRQDRQYRFFSYEDWAGSSGHDAPMIAYDALLGCHGSWAELCNRAMFHGGDSDTTGCIAGCLYGAMFGFHGVPMLNHEHVEYRQRLVEIGSRLHAAVAN